MPRLQPSCQGLGRALLLLVASAALATPIAEAAPSFAQDFETGSFSPMTSGHATSEGLEIVTGGVDGVPPAYSGSKLVRSEIMPGRCWEGDQDESGDCTRYHEQFVLSPQKDSNLFVEGEETWGAFSVYLDRVPRDDGSFFALGDFHPRSGSTPCSTNAKMKLDSVADGLLRGLEAEVSQGETCESAEERQAATYPLALQEWHRIVVHAKWSTGSDGFFELYADDSAESISSVDGRTLYSEISDSNSASDTYLKLGIYVSDSLGDAYRPRVYYDLVAFGSSRDEVERPAAGSSSSPAGDDAEPDGFLAVLEEIGHKLLSVIERLEAALS